MILELKRLKKLQDVKNKNGTTSKGTIGELYINGTFFCNTLEPDFPSYNTGDNGRVAYDSYEIIVENGEIKVKYYWNNNKNKRVIYRDGSINIEVGNYRDNTKGCILVGTYQNNQLIDSKKAYDTLLSYITTSLNNEERIQLIVSESTKDFFIDTIPSTNELWNVIFYQNNVISFAWQTTFGELKRTYTNLDNFIDKNSKFDSSLMLLTPIKFLVLYDDASKTNALELESRLKKIKNVTVFSDQLGYQAVSTTVTQKETNLLFFIKPDGRYIILSVLESDKDSSLETRIENLKKKYAKINAIICYPIGFEDKAGELYSKLSSLLNRNTDKIYTSVAYEIPTTKPSQPLYERILNISFVVALGKVYILDKVLDLDTFLKSLSSSVPSYECDIIAYTIYYAQNDEDSKLANQIKFIIEKDKPAFKVPSNAQVGIYPLGLNPEKEITKVTTTLVIDVFVCHNDYLITKNANGEVIAIDGKAFVKDVLQDLKAKNDVIDIQIYYVSNLKDYAEGLRYWVLNSLTRTGDTVRPLIEIRLKNSLQKFVDETPLPKEDVESTAKTPTETPTDFSFSNMLIFGGIIAGVVLLLFFSNKKKKGQQRKELETKTKKPKTKEKEDV